MKTRTAVLCLLLAAACKLQEVTIPLGEEVLVVQGVMNAGAGSQYIVVERSLTGTLLIPDQDSLRGPPRPPLPISNALVVVTRDDGDSIQFAEIADTAGVYRFDRASSPEFFAAGREYRLRVLLPDGRVVTGRTRMPDFPTVTGLPDGNVLNRDHDTLDVRWTGARWSKGVFVQVRPRDLARRLTLLLFTDSTHFRVPGALPLPLTSDTIPPMVWVPGTRETFTVAAMDTNFFNFFRTANDPFTGSGFINTVAGGLGVFGSMAPVNRTYVVSGEVDHPWEGCYELELATTDGTRQTQLQLFVSRDRPEPVLVNGIVFEIPDTPSPCLPGLLSFGSFSESAGRVESGRLHLWVYTTEPAPIGEPALPLNRRMLLEGGFDPSGTAAGTVRDRRGVQIGTYRLIRLKGANARTGIAAH